MMPHAERRKNIERMLERSPNDSFLLYGRAMSFIAEGREEEGIAALSTLVEAHPDYHAAYFQLGQILGARGEIDDAKDWLARGAAVAAKQGDSKAADEMEAFRDAL
jgi:tetratricopeptide (TPR) repeat protein